MISTPTVAAATHAQRRTARDGSDPVARPRHARHEQRATAPCDRQYRMLRRFAGAVMVSMLSAGLGGAVAAVAYPHTEAVSKRVTSTGLRAAPPTGDAARGSVEQAAAKVLPSVVELKTDRGDEIDVGSGIILSADGVILTNSHVVSSPADDPNTHGGGETQVIMADGRSAPSTVVGVDHADDIAVVRVQGLTGLTPIMLGSSDNLLVGQQVVAVGSPLGLNGTVTSGIISALNRSLPSANKPAITALPTIQTDVLLNPGNSGGALVDMNGQLIGINSAIASPDSTSWQSGSTGIGFAIPVEQATRIADRLIAGDAS
jgi:putative serine protease PepD